MPINKTVKRISAPITRVRVSILAAIFAVAAAAACPAQTIPDINAEETPLHWSAEHGLYRISSELIENGAKVNAPDSFGRTPLHLAVAYTDVLQLLLDNGGNPNAQDMFGRTPLHLALQYPMSVVVLLGAGADVSATDFMGDTPLERTLRYGTRSRNLEVISLLLDAGAGSGGR